MKEMYIINIFDEFNMNNILPILKFKATATVVICSNGNLKDSKELLTKQFKESNQELEVKFEMLKSKNYEGLKEIVEKYNDKELIINVTGGEKILSLLLLRISYELNIKCIYVDRDKEEILDLRDDSITKMNEVILQIEDFVKGSGSVIIEEASRLFEDTDVKEFTKYIMENYESWKIISQLFRNPNIVEQNFIQKEDIKINLDKLECDHVKMIEDMCKNIETIGIGTVEYLKPENIIVRLKSMELKSFIFKSGTWLEVVVYSILKDFDYLEDVKGGLVFAWENNTKGIKNEVDVIATNDSKLIYISCKDSNKYDAQALNEINVYAEKLGGDKVKKILIATHEPEKKSILERAEEMEIKIMILGKDTQKLKKELNAYLLS